MKRQSNQGFTLIELITVVTIIGVLVAISLPKFVYAINKTKASEAVQRLHQIYKALIVYENERGTYIATAASGSEATFNFSAIGISEKSNYFVYTVVADNISFEARATVPINNKVGMVNGGDYLAINQEQERFYFGDGWILYASAYVEGATAR